MDPLVILKQVPFAQMHSSYLNCKKMSSLSNVSDVRVPATDFSLISLRDFSQQPWCSTLMLINSSTLPFSASAAVVHSKTHLSRICNLVEEEWEEGQEMKRRPMFRLIHSHSCITCSSSSSILIMLQTNCILATISEHIIQTLLWEASPGRVSAAKKQTGWAISTFEMIPFF